MIPTARKITDSSNSLLLVKPMPGWYAAGLLATAAAGAPVGAGSALATLRQPSMRRRNRTRSTDWASSNACEASTPEGAPSCVAVAVNSGATGAITVAGVFNGAGTSPPAQSGAA